MLKLVHFHLGSQITDIRHVKAGLEEISRYYAELRGMGFDITHVDVGGGLGVDYDGSRSTRSGQRQLHDAGVRQRRRLHHRDRLPNRRAADAAHHQRVGPGADGAPRAAAGERDRRGVAGRAVAARRCGEEPHPLLQEMAENLEALDTERIEEVFHDAVFAKERTQEYFASGVFSLRDKADAEQLYLATLHALQQAIGEDKTVVPRDHGAHRCRRWWTGTSATSRSSSRCPDHWAIDQLFPIMPIHRLLEPPTRRGTLQDMTCDSDGVIDRFAGGRKGKPSLELHPVREGEPYILGIFLTGAYQEILGDLHNLFGDTNAVHVRLTEQGYEITDMVHGDTVTEVLNYVQFHASDLLATFRRKVANAKGPVAAGGEFVHRGFRGGVGGVYVSGGGYGGGE